MSECEKCGREDGHHLGCSAASGGVDAPSMPPSGGEACAYEGCPYQRRPRTGKGPAPKYCQEHSDPKNRK